MAETLGSSPPEQEEEYLEEGEENVDNDSDVVLVGMRPGPQKSADADEEYEDYSDEDSDSEGDGGNVDAVQAGYDVGQYTSQQYTVEEGDDNEEDVGNVDAVQAGYDVGQYNYNPVYTVQGMVDGDEGEESDVYELKDDEEEGVQYVVDDDEDEDEELEQADKTRLTALLLDDPNVVHKNGDAEEEDDEEYEVEVNEGVQESATSSKKRQLDEVEKDDSDQSSKKIKS